MFPAWHPDLPPIYDIHKSYQENVAQGPFFKGKFFERKSPDRFYDFLGYRVRSRLGIPAGPLLNAKWIAFAAKMGFDILTYKTIRSEAHPGHRLPNVTYIDSSGHQIQVPSSLDKLTITNSFGMPSQSPEFLLEDIALAQRSLSLGQLLIVSVVGTPKRGATFAEDFVRTALLAREAGAQVIEANFSCPNVKRAEGILYQDPETVHEYTRLIAKAIHPIPLILKVGLFPDTHQMKSVFLAAARGGARAICGINSVSKEIYPPLDPTRPTSGICGAAIRNEALSFVRDASKIIRENKLDFALLGCGGILLPEHFDLFFEAGADIALSATGMMWDPYLALRYN